MMIDPPELIGLIENPQARRLWLLYNAMQHLPLPQAIECARSADCFLTGSFTDKQLGDAHLDTASDAEDSDVCEQPEQLATETSSIASVEHPTTAKSTRLAVTAEHRERLLDRLAQGAKNAELAAEFGVSLRQVQGLRMGCAREIAQRRDQLGKEPARVEPTSLSASVGEIVRYLRQQDDVVVQQPNGDFLLNGRFNLSLADLLARANRMRGRQRKPLFELLGGMRGGEKNSSTNGHPLFWEESVNSHARS
jgi:hypothetical protein